MAVLCLLVALGLVLLLSISCCLKDGMHCYDGGIFLRLAFSPGLGSMSRIERGRGLSLRVEYFSLLFYFLLLLPLGFSEAEAPSPFDLDLVFSFMSVSLFFSFLFSPHSTSFPFLQ
jgi:hypothetical protein